MFCLQNLICHIIIFADQVFIDPTFFGIFVCGPLQSLVVYVCAWCKSIFFDLFWSVELFVLRLNESCKFLQSAFWIWITKWFSLVRECNIFAQCCITLGPCSLLVIFCRHVKSWRIVIIYRSKIIRMKCSLNWSCINYGELHCDLVDSSLVFS